jgi:hypothetical protein
MSDDPRYFQQVWTKPREASITLLPAATAAGFHLTVHCEPHTWASIRQELCTDQYARPVDAVLTGSKGDTAIAYTIWPSPGAGGVDVVRAAEHALEQLGYSTLGTSHWTTH